MPPVGFEPTVSAGKRPQTYALDRAATGTGLQGNHALHKFHTPEISNAKFIIITILLSRS